METKLVQLILNKTLIVSFMLYFPLEGMLPKPRKTLIIERKYLKSAIISVDEKDELGRTALHIAVLEDDTNDVKVLLSRGALLTEKDNNGLTPVDYAHNNDKLINVRNFFTSLNISKPESREN